MRSSVFNGIDEQALRRSRAFGRLVSPHTGLIQRVEFLEQDLGLPALTASATSLGNLTHVYPHIVSPDGTDVSQERLGGAGASSDPVVAWTKSVVESAERYATMVYRPEEFVLASAIEFGRAAIDLDTIPRLSKAELADSRCPLRLPDSSRAIRWVCGFSLVTKREVYVPAIMTHLYLEPLESELFWAPISTGVAAHTSLVAAVVGGLYEAIERDAIALTWLLRRRLPRIDPLGVSLPTDAKQVLRRGGIRQVFLDATTDIEVPCVVALQESPHHQTCKVFVTASSNRTLERACCKAFDEFAPSRTAMRGGRLVPDNVSDFRSLLHGADYYASGHGRSRLAFLLDEGPSPCESRAAPPHAPIEDSVEAELRWLVERLRALGMEVVVVDLTSDELAAVGLHVVRVIVPELMPISFIHRARFLGSSRLRRFAQASGAPFDAESLNHDPIPFA